MVPMRTIAPLLIAFWTAISTAAGSDADTKTAAPVTIPLWPGPAPGDQGALGEEKDLTKPGEGLVAGKTVIRLGNVSRPTMTICPPPPGKTPPPGEPLIWTVPLLGAKDALAAVHPDTGHAFPPEALKAAYEFLEKALKQP